ncbi:hypothetical protein RSK20926_21405 [Roseobacter sp. SK209-2-6]|uniref:hypothetical protein n=1 Tax=Roseobacter sp. SK209-2-6 TaxID=388739 RepID=UPI0000F3E76B|nr:hypothetical protein [Roseobacter sp. SK209-2-6]EBA16325.1 hypothetical protein RSK20926_21405 [Roseobacter sp. SK209-2-6]
MKYVAALAALFLGAVPVQAQDWVKLDGVEIAQGLTGQELLYENGDRQQFLKSGETPYFASRPSTGYWGVRGDQYCSVWPPSDLWSCYDLERSGPRFRFTGKHGDQTVGVLVE